MRVARFCCSASRPMTEIMHVLDADKEVKLLTFARSDRVPRGYAATREGEPIRMGAQSQFMSLRSYCTHAMFMLASADDFQRELFGSG